MDDPLTTAITRMEEFRRSWNDGDEICECSKLSPADLDQAITAMREKAGGHGDPTMRELR